MTIELWTFKTCPYCVRAKALLDDLSIQYIEHMIPYGDQQLKVLEKETGCSTLPQLIVDGKFIGDCSKMIELHDNQALLPILGGK